MSRRAAELAEVAHCFFFAEKAEVPTALRRDHPDGFSVFSVAPKVPVISR